MPVKINNESDVSLFAYLLYEIFDRTYFRTVEVFVSRIPFSIKILSCQICSIMPENNPIRVHHRNNINNIIFE